MLGRTRLAALTVAWLVPLLAHAQTQIKPRVLLMVDTSGSMAAQLTDNCTTGGDGSTLYKDAAVNLPGYYQGYNGTVTYNAGTNSCTLTCGVGGFSGQRSRMYAAKQAILNVLNASGDIDWGLMRYSGDACPVQATPSPSPPLPKNRCTKNSDCPSNVCDTATNECHCSTAAQCGANTTCSSTSINTGYCVCNTGGNCGNNQRCEASGGHNRCGCGNGFCGSFTCGANDATARRLCQATACTTDFDCAAGQVCAGGVCVVDANLCNDGNTEYGETSNACVIRSNLPITYAGGCGPDSATGGNCSTVQTCYADTDCTGGTAGSNRCTALTGSSATACTCTGNAQCPTNWVCTGGRCVYNQSCRQDGGFVLVPPSSAGATDQILQYADGVEDYTPKAGAPTQPTNPELRADGNTPLAGAARTATAWYNSVIASDPQKACRPYILVQLTDGEDTCEPNNNGDRDTGPVAAAQGFVAATTAGARTLNKVYVIGLAFGGAANPTLDATAKAGGTNAARYANSQEDIQAALADIVGSSVLVEKCNNMDDDCNGVCDEPFPDVGIEAKNGCAFRAAKTCDNGALPGTKCYASGSYQCSGDGRSEVCSAATCATNPALCATTETCNGQDDDCNGVVDDCTPFVAGSCCATSCPACNPTGVPQPETCNGCDDDCDGTADNHLIDTGLACGQSVGICAPGLTACCQQTTPTPGTCTTDPVTSGPAHANKDGLFCLGGQGAATEVCDGVDNDCNGLTDEVGTSCFPFPAPAMPSQGICAGGTASCATSPLPAGSTGCPPGWPAGKACPNPTPTYGTCVGAVGPQAETCDGIDNDCDGTIDDSVTDTWAGTTCCPTGNPADCMGASGSSCMLGTFKCVGGQKVCTVGVAKSPEVCDGLDNDCNGSIDDAIPGNGSPCTGPGSVINVGECRAVFTCTGAAGPGPSGLTCTQAVGPAPELCNGLDDDCDGQIDEAPLMDNRVGVQGGPPCVPLEPGKDQAPCDPGHTECVNGAVVCVGAVGPQPNQCNGISTDCTGVPNTNGNCPTGYECYQGNCLLPCGSGEFPCPGGFVCQPSTNLCIPDVCAKLSCQPPLLCQLADDGTAACVDPCASVDCKAGLRCKEGVCVDDSCKTFGCPDGQICIGSPPACQVDPCYGVECAPGQFCQDGQCTMVCSGPCPPGEACITGECKPDPCAGVSCKANEVCVVLNETTGVCQENLCSAGCLTGKVCCAASCHDDPCAFIGCPDGSHCAVDVNSCGAGCQADAAGPKDEIVGQGGGGAGACALAPHAAGSGPGTLAVVLGLCVLGLLRRVRLRRAGLIALALAAVPASGCHSDPYCLNCGSGGGAVSTQDLSPIYYDLAPVVDLTGATPDLTVTGDGGPCVPSNAGVEKCDGVDNDCNGTVDDVSPNVLADPNNCGACGHACNYTAQHQFGMCVVTGGVAACQPAGCLPGFVDLDPNTPGCEYACTPTSDPTEICDGKDNNCDGRVDENSTNTWKDAGKQQPVYDREVANCGGCGNACTRPGAVAVCKAGGVCGVDHCINDGADTYRHDPSAGDRDVTGCEYHCATASTTATSGSHDCDDTACSFPAELCDGVDNDCDFVTDDSPTDVGAPCADKCPGGLVANCLGECKAGTLTCSSGVRLCVGSVGPGTETCDGKDNNCDGQVDEPFTAARPGGYADGNAAQQPLYNSDPAHCGGCAQPACALAHATNGCHTDATLDASKKGVCYVVQCQGGFSYAPKQPKAGDPAGTCTGGPPGPKDGPSGVGCYYGCAVAQAPETCDGQDNDCNGCVDDGITQPVNFCATLGECAGKGIQPKCTGAPGWRCNYADFPTIDVDANGNLTAVEKRCDGRDNNCNGSADKDGFSTLGNNCSAGTGACQNSGTIQCDPGDATKSDCFTAGGVRVSAAPTRARDESCNGVDDDCDGVADERWFPQQSCTNDASCQVTTAGTCATGATGKACKCASASDCPSGYSCSTDPRSGATRFCTRAPTCYDASGLNPHACAPYVEPMVQFTNASSANEWVYAYEASRPDSTPTSPGGNAARACSKAGVQPWSNVTEDEAEANCNKVLDSTGAPMHLCSAADWTVACQGASPPGGGNSYGYSTARTTYSAKVCNDVNNAAAPAVWVTGFTSATATSLGKLCYASWPSSPVTTQIHDMSGNLAEWTSTTLTAQGNTYYKIRGGNYTSPSDGVAPDGTSCEFDFVIAAQSFANADLGFRCCAAHAP